MALLLRGINAQLAMAQCANEANIELLKLSARWQVTEKEAFELIDLYRAHSIHGWQQSVINLSGFDYDQARQYVSTVCMG